MLPINNRKAVHTYLLIIIATGIILFLLAGCKAQVVVRVPDIDQIEGTYLSARTGERYFQVFGGENWESLYINGVNIGTALPGKWYTQFPSDRELYHSWLEQIAAMNVNTVRIYTLLDPSFYQVFYEFNRDPANPRLWLIQEIWPHDEVPGLNFYDADYTEAYKREVDMTIDALHGNAEILPRSFRAYGYYTADVSPYVLGVLIGRELEPEEVEATDKANPQITEHRGDYVYALKTTATEAWLAELCDYTMKYAQANYNWQYPVGFVSWPTLDPLTHLTEWDEDGKAGYNDREEVRPDIFERGPLNRAGFFGAYHIYPNYPDLMNNEPGFADFADGEGTFRYIGYLNDFIEIHPPYPALVAEFGISTSLNTAHLNPDGLHHGMLCEVEQGEMTVRMMKSIAEKGYAGSIIFEWTDEWAKKTWNTEPYMVPWERQNLWKNAMDPEQNYGILSYEPDHKPFDGEEGHWWDSPTGESAQPLQDRGSFGKIKSLHVDADEAFLYIAIDVEGISNEGQNGIQWDDFGLLVGIDTGIREAGEFRLPVDGMPDLPTGVEFLMYISSLQDAGMLVVPSYNRAELKFKSEPSHNGNFTRIEPVVNRERMTMKGIEFPALRSDESKLRYGFFDPEHEDFSSLSHWYVDWKSERFVVRLPWMLLNVSDPSAGIIINDDGEFVDMPLRDELQTEITDGFIFYAATFAGDFNDDNLADTPSVIDFQPRQGDSFARVISPYLWNLWEEPSYRARLKKSYPIIAKFSEQLSQMELD